MTEVFLAETAAGVTAAAPTATFAGPDGRMILLNPLRWLDSSGPCYDSNLGPLCVFGTKDKVTPQVVNLILSSLSLAAPAPHLGGTPFTPGGDDPMSTLVPGWVPNDAPSPVPCPPSGRHTRAGAGKLTVADCSEGGCRCALSSVTMEEAGIVLGTPAPEGTTTLVRYDGDYIWSPAVIGRHRPCRRR